MNAKQLERQLAETGIRTADEIDRRTRALRADGKLPKGGHGRQAPHLTPVELGFVLIALAGARTGKDAPLAVDTYAGLPTEAPLAGHYYFADALGWILSAADNAAQVMTVSIYAQAPAAVIRTRMHTYNFMDEGTQIPAAAVVYQFSAGVLFDLAYEYRKPSTSGHVWNSPLVFAIKGIEREHK